MAKTRETKLGEATMWSVHKASRLCKNRKTTVEKIGSCSAGIEFATVKPPTYKEIMKIIMKMKSSGSPYPLDQISEIILKRCPIRRTYVWKNKYFPTKWKNGITVLIYKKQDPTLANDPANFSKSL